MARLIVETGGVTRRFKLGEGKLTLGSGQAATLTLDSEELAEVHAELEVSGDKVTLRTRKGTTPPRVRGREASGEVILKPGVPVSLGDVTLSVEGDAPPPSAPPGRSPSRSGARAPRAGRARSGDAGRPTVQRTRPRADTRSLPAWAIVLMILVAVGIGIALFRHQAGEMAEEGFDPKASQVRVENRLDDADYRGAARAMEKVDRNWDELDESWRRIFEGYRKQIDHAAERAELMSRNTQGTQYLQSQLENFVDEYLDEPNRPAARVLLKRIAYFKERFPLHPGIDWCNRMAGRWRSVAEPSEPPTFEDVAFEVKTMTWAYPRDYVTAFAILDEFIADSSGEARRKAEALRKEHEGERREYFEDRMEQAKYLFRHDTDEMRGKAVFWLVQLVTKIADEQMANEAAEVLVDIPGVDSPLRGYHNEQPEVFEALMRNPVVRRYVEENDVLADV